MTAFTLNKKRIVSARIVVGNKGPWVADVNCEDSDPVSGQVNLVIGEQVLVGTVDAAREGAYESQRAVRIIGGAGGWSKPVTAKHYHNDAQIKARTIADDAARAVGETLDTFVPAEERVGVDYVRAEGLASNVLEDVIGPVAWWVGFDGKTRVGTRATNLMHESDYEVLAYDPRYQKASISVVDISKVSVGSIISKNLDSAKTIRELEIQIDQDELRVIAWCGGTASGAGHLVGLMQSIIQKTSDARVYGKYRYRVVRMNSGRVELQAVRKSAGFPDILPISMWPGVAGVHAELTPGAEVLVEFEEGDRKRPIVTHFAGKDGTGFVPVSLTLGGSTGPEAARKGDAVEVLLPPAVFSGTIGGTPATGVLTFPLVKTIGVITAGSSKVKVAT